MNKLAQNSNFHFSKSRPRRLTDRINYRRLLISVTLLGVLLPLLTIASPAFLLALFLLGVYLILGRLSLNLLSEISLLLNWRLFGVLAGLGLYSLLITPASAAIFDRAEQYTTQIFGSYIDTGLITLIFGFLRISSFIIGAAFVLLALEKARHGENWQPFAWNAFAVLMVVVLVEGTSALFLGSSSGEVTRNVKP